MANSNKNQENGWGGQWTEQKLDCFERYVKAYLTIMNTYRDKYGWKLLYFDGFAGCGGRTAEEKREEHERAADLFGAGKVDSDELMVYQGAAERVMKVGEEMRGFDFYYFIDLFEENCTRLQLKLTKYSAPGVRQFRPGDANDMTMQLAQAMRQRPYIKSLVLLDPFGMSIRWTTLEDIALKGVDLWILLPSGVIINRLLEKDGALKHYAKLRDFFGLSEYELRTWFYEKKEGPNLFGETDQWYEKKHNPIQLIADLYMERLGELFEYVTTKPLVMKNRNNVPIYHFVCASNNPSAVKIAQQIIDKRQQGGGSHGKE